MLQITPKIIEECFVFSLMTVYNEKLNSRKYTYQIFVEFQEMFCRIAYIGFLEQDNVEFKVFWLMQYYWEDSVKKGLWDEERYPLVKVNTDYIW